MSGEIFVDTFFVIALINQRDAYHAQASRLADELEGQPLVITAAGHDATSNFL